MTTSSKTSWRRTFFGAGILSLALLLTGCDPTLIQLSAIVSKYESEPEQAEELFESHFKTSSEGLNAARRQQALDMAFGNDVIYVSPEQEERFFSSMDAFVHSIVPGVLGSMPGDGSATAQNPLFEYLRSLRPIVLGAIKAQSQELIDERVEQIRKRSGDYAGYLDSEHIRDIAWDDDRYEGFLTDNAAAVAELSEAIRDHSPYPLTPSDPVLAGLQETILPVTLPTPQPPS